jgi:DNA-binding beta-propeller fold protein YncE/tRNA A-37 threonylcarbamoyl transferase component Bud32
VSEQTPPAPGDFGVGSHVAGYRLDEQIGRGGMAVVYRAYDDRLERRVALKILAPELARDEEFRLRFIRESRAAAAVDHPNIIPIYEAGGGDGILFIAMRFVDGRDVQRLISDLHPLPVARVCDIVAQVASALDAAHAHGLVHRDVKPGNMLREATSGQAQPDHVYLSDFGLSKHALGASAALTSQGQFLGTLNYVAPEQIEGRPVDGRTDQYALACSAFEMLAGEPPFRRNESLAIMWAQLSSAPPSVSSMRTEVPAAADEVMSKALAKAPDDRYASCLEFAAALRQACGSGPGADSPPPAIPGRGATRAVRPDELAAAAASVAGDQPGQPPGPADTGPGSTQVAGTSVPGGGVTPASTAETGAAAASVPPASTAETGAASVPPASTAETGAAPASMPGAEPASGGPPTQAARVQGAAPARAGLTDPMGDFEQLYRPRGAPPRAPVTEPPRGPATVPPRRRSRRGLAAAVAAGVVLLGAGGAYLLLGGGGSGHTHTGTTARVLALPPCTTKAGHAARLHHIHTAFAQVGGKPFDVVVTHNHFGFVSLRKGFPLVVMNTAAFTPTTVQSVPATNPAGEALTHNQQYLLVAGGDGMTVFRVGDLESGLTAPVGSLAAPGAAGALQVLTSPDDKFAFVVNQDSGNVAVFNLRKALTTGFGPDDFVGMIPTRSDPTGITASPDGRYLYVVSGLASNAIQSGMGTLAIVGMHKAETTPESSVIKIDDAGCGPARVITSPDGKDVWVTAGGGNALEAFSAAKLLSDPSHALIARVAVGEIPLGMVLVSNGMRMVVADSNRDGSSSAAANLAVIDVAKALAGKPAVLGTIKSGRAPRQFALEPNGKTLLVTNTGSGQVEAVNVGHLP